jgi:hypothetical protein
LRPAVVLADAAVKEPRNRLLKPNPLRRFRWAALCRFHEFDLLGVEDFEMSSLLVQHDHLAVRANHKIISVGDNKRLLVAQDYPNRLKWVGLH